ncbi:MAG: ABC transporter ATP-binding protein/permease [Hormoscilla sp. GM7CHS1pb]|nr:ABC transporter ATP-binding protein/permease [Hormoscilla sp. GM7CHS1pb]
MNKFDWQLWKKFLAIAKPYWFSEEKWGARGILALLLLLSLSVSGLNVLISFVGRIFQNALVEKNPEEFWKYLFIYAGVFVVGTPIVVIYRYTRDKLGLYWREWLTKSFLNKYLQNRAYYEINATKTIDNPDQRISQDIRSFTVTSLGFLLVILSSLINLISFTGILWSISIPLTVVLVGYSILGTVVTVLFGRRLIGLNFNQLRREADFRYGLVHVRDHAEAIAFYRGEEQEGMQLKARFTEVIGNFNALIGWQRNLDFFTTAYGYFIIILPSVVVAPMYFAGEIDFGAISQASFAFSQVLGALSIVVSQFEQISAFAAGINRLSVFTDTLEAQTARKQIERTIDLREDSQLSLEHITLETPNHKTLVADLSVEVPFGTGMLIVGHSGVGKSSLLRAIAGLWNSGTGLLVRPPLDEILFLPQRPYMILGTLRDQLLYPQTDRTLPDAELQAVLERVNLADLAERLGGFDTELDWDDVLSLGEQQRLAFARLLLTKPDYAILDEATSALDLQNEASLYQQLQKSGTTYISVGHRGSLLKYHQRVLELQGNQQWRVMSADKYDPGVGAFT